MKDLEKIITKELLRNVLPKEIENLSDNFSFTINEDYIEFSDDGEMQFEYCIYKFAFKCKEWVLKQGYRIIINYSKDIKVGIRILKSGKYVYSNENKSEVEAVIKASEYIMKEIKENNV